MIWLRTIIVPLCELLLPWIPGSIGSGLFSAEWSVFLLIGNFEHSAVSVQSVAIVAWLCVTMCNLGPFCDMTLFKWLPLAEAACLIQPAPSPRLGSEKIYPLMHAVQMQNSSSERKCSETQFSPFQRTKGILGGPNGCLLYLRRPRLARNWKFGRIKHSLGVLNIIVLSPKFC